MPKINIAESAGFCFGVDRAVKIVYDGIGNRRQAVLGELIHNKDVISDLQSRGVRKIDSLDEAEDGETVIIRSHGVPKSVYNELKNRNISYIDATCPYVEKIHKVVEKCSAEGYNILIMGDKEHCEVKGILGFCVDNAYVFKNDEEILNFLKKDSEIIKKKVAIIAQTTYNIRMWDTCVKIAQEYCPQIKIFDTICNATELRQKEAVSLAESSDVMVVVGGRHSSNTLKLYDVCSAVCRCYLIENADELEELDFSGAEKIGITAGASTPAYIIKEVQRHMSEQNKMMDEDFNFEEALEASCKKIYTGNRVKGYITAVNNSEAVVDIGSKHTGYVPLSELTDDPNLKPSDIVKVGDTIDLIVTKINDQEGIAYLSKKQVDAKDSYEKIQKAFEDGSVLEGVVTQVIKGGILVSANGAKVFIPASHATLRREDNLDELLKKTVQFKIIKIGDQGKRAVGSIREVLKGAKAESQKKFWDSVKIGDKFKGEVKSVTEFGAFVDLGGIDGMVHKSELSWKRIKHPSDVVKVGDVIDVYVKDLDMEKNRISLGYKKNEDNPWEKFKAEYNVGDVVKASVVSITSFGAFAQIIPGIDGLIHISQIANQRVEKVSDFLKVGQEVEAKITEIDADKERISISMRALLEDAGESDNAEVSDAE